jgi:hypothetical protein
MIALPFSPLHPHRRLLLPPRLLPLDPFSKLGAASPTLVIALTVTLSSIAQMQYIKLAFFVVAATAIVCQAFEIPHDSHVCYISNYLGKGKDVEGTCCLSEYVTI